MTGENGQVHESAEVAAWLAKLPADKKPIVEKLRNLALESMPGAEEFIYHDALVYGPSKVPFRPLVYIAVHTNHINLGFYIGSRLKDPHKLLIGDGKRMRHIKIFKSEGIDNPEIGRLLSEAWEDSLKQADKLYKR